MGAPNFYSCFEASKTYSFIPEDESQYEFFEEEVLNELEKNGYEIVDEWTRRERIDVKLLARKQVFTENGWFYGEIEVLLIPGYYYGVQLDYLVTKYDCEDGLLDDFYYENFDEFIEDLASHELDDEEDELYELKLKTLKEQIKKDHETLDDVIGEECYKLEKILEKLTTPLSCEGIDSNGEAFYRKV